MLRKEAEARGEAERVARAQAEERARRDADLRARQQAEEAARRVPEPPPTAGGASWSIAKVVTVAALVIGAVLLYSQWNERERIAKAEAEARVRAEAVALAEARAKKEAEDKAKAEAAVLAKKQAEDKAKADALAKKEAEEKAAEAHKQVQKPGAVFSDCPDCPKMVVIPAGSFQMGSNDGDSTETPVHTVRIGRPFALAKTEVTQVQWRAVMGNNPSHFSGCDACPVESVSWNDAQDFARRLSQKTGKTYRLRSEAQWEYACRAGGTQSYCGSENVGAVAWLSDNSGSKTHAVAGKQPNAWGLYDMSGNVWEWVADCWNASYSGAPGDGSAWMAGDWSLRVVRGGSWGNLPRSLRSGNRLRSSTASRGSLVGFRLARTLE